MKNISFILFLSTYCTLFSQIANPPTNIIFCDNTNDGIEIIDLSIKNSEILGGQDPSQFEVAYFLNEMDASNFINAITNPYTASAANTTIYARVSDTTTNNFDITSFLIVLNALPVFSLEAQQELCNTTGITNVTINLSTTDYEFKWFKDTTLLTETSNTLEVDEIGDYRVQVKDMLTNCFSEMDFVVITVDCRDQDDDLVRNEDEDINKNGNLDDDDTDNDSIANYLDDDDDNDGILTIDEDYNGNGDPTDDDTNSNDIPDYLERTVALSISDFEEKIIAFYPNPTTTIFTIQIPKEQLKSDMIIEMLDLKGSSVLTQKIENVRTNINIENLPKGIYVAKVISDKITFKKILKN